MTSKRSSAQALVEECFPNDISQHIITPKFVNEADGYGHWRCHKPDTNTLYFDIVVWPGSLCYTGDMGDYLFQRTHDMIGFMQKAASSIEYAAEKCVAGRDELMEYREELFYQYLEDVVPNSGYTEEDDSKRIAELRAKVADVKHQYQYGGYNSEFKAYEFIHESGLCDGGDPPNFKEYKFHFHWALKAIQWFCDKQRP